jgi:hypothetical protein
MTRTIKAHFDGKVFVPDEPVDVPAGQTVTLEVRQEVEPAAKRGTLADLADWAETLPRLPDSPGDAAAQHDHYLYGTPKRDNPRSSLTPVI